MKHWVEYRLALAKELGFNVCEDEVSCERLEQPFSKESKDIKGILDDIGYVRHVKASKKVPSEEKTKRNEASHRSTRYAKLMLNSCSTAQLMNWSTAQLTQVASGWCSLILSYFS